MIKILRKNIKQKILHCYTAFRVPGSKQYNTDRSSVFNTFYVSISSKENETKTRVTYPMFDLFIQICISYAKYCFSIVSACETYEECHIHEHFMVNIVNNEVTTA